MMQVQQVNPIYVQQLWSQVSPWLDPVFNKSLLSTYYSIDNLKGYVKTNVVPCCVTCNFMKARLGVNEFINQVEMIHEHGLKTDKI